MHGSECRTCPSQQRGWTATLCATGAEDEQGNPLKLRDVIAQLRKADDPSAMLHGLAALPQLLQAAPHELASNAGMWLVLSHCRAFYRRRLLAGGRLYDMMQV